MKLTLSALFSVTCFVAVAANCGAPANYTVINSNAQAQNGTQASSWPDLSTWNAEQSGSSDVAVIIAIEDYAFLPDVTGAVQNANDWEQYFRINRGMEDVFVLSNQDAPIEEIERFAKQAVDASKEGGTLWFVFIGHGAAKTDGSDGLLIGMDAQQTIESLTARSLAKADIVKVLDKGNQTNTVMVLDTCFSGRSSSGELLAQGTQPVIPIATSPVTKNGLALLSAAKGDQVAGQLPGATRPAFSYLLLGALRGWADADGDKSVTTQEAINFTQKQLRLLKGRQQTPDITGEGSIVLASNVAEADPGVAALISNAGTVATSNNDSAEITDEGTKIDTGRGVVIPKLDSYALPDRVFPGTVFFTQRMTEPTIISVAKQKMSQMTAASAIGNLFNSEYSIGTQWITEPSEEKYGEFNGSMAAYKESQEGFDDKFGFLFATYQNDALWIYRLETTSEKLLYKRGVDLEEMVSKSEFR